MRRRVSVRLSISSFLIRRRYSSCCSSSSSIMASSTPLVSDRLRTYLTTHAFYGLQYFFCIAVRCHHAVLFVLVHPSIHRFREGGIPLGVTFAFLITSPLVNEVAVAMFLGTFGLKITIIYVISSMLLRNGRRFYPSKMRLENYLSDWVKNIQKTSGG